MKTYSYAFGDHTLFLRKDVLSHPGLAHAWLFGGMPLLHVYEGASHHLNVDGCLGGNLVAVIECNEEIFRKFYRHYMPGTPIRRANIDFHLMERYIVKLIRRRAKEQK